MALQSDPESTWKKFFLDAGVGSEELRARYTTTFIENGITAASLPLLDKETLIELGVDIIGHRLGILNLAKPIQTAITPGPPQIAQILQSTPPTPTSKASVSAKLPTLTSEMTHPQFRKFKIDWKVYKTLTSLTPEYLTSHLYNACDDIVQNTIINTEPEFLTLDENAALTIIESIVTQRVNPAVHRMTFGSITQNETETIQSYVVRLRSSATECSFQCPNCSTDLSEINIKDQFIRGLANSQLQTDILAKANQLSTLIQTITHAESFETALQNQNMLTAESSTTLFFRFMGGGDSSPSPSPTLRKILRDDKMRGEEN